ncbi:MAG: hypothetical protein ACRBCS_15300 [Cellvibrionaceae bacterium]
MFTLNEAAFAHALAAEKILEPKAQFLNENEEVIPVFVNLLFQSVEISLKSFALDAKIATEEELRDRKLTGNGHKIDLIAKLIDSRTGKDLVVDLILPEGEFPLYNQILKAMVYEAEFEPTRESYASRNVTYSQFKAGELQVLGSVKDWVDAVKIFSKNVTPSVARLNG